MLKRIFFKRVSYCLLLVLVGCSWLQSTDKKVEPDINIQLLPKPETLKENFFVTQQAKGRYKNTHYTLQLTVEKNIDKLVLVGLGQMGIVLFNVSYDGQTIKSATSSLLPKRMNPTYVLRDFLWAYWPLQSLEKAFIGTDFLVQETHGERWIFNKGEPLLSIDYGDGPWSDTVKINNALRGYSLEISTLMREPL